jgi:hypothetical protein
LKRTNAARTIPRVRLIASHVRSARSRRGRLHWADAAVLLAVGVVVLLVSLPRLREFALRENETDARTLVTRLGEVCAREMSAGTLAQALEREPQLVARLDDAEWLAQGRILRRHGYLFELDASRTPARVLAWPWDHGRTGFRAFRWEAGALEGHSNPGGAWSGVEAPPFEGTGPEGWRPLAR